MTQAELNHLREIVHRGDTFDPEFRDYADLHLRSEFQILDARTQFHVPYARKLHSRVKKEIRRRLNEYLERTLRKLEESIDDPDLGRMLSFKAAVCHCARKAYTALFAAIYEDIKARTEPSDSSTPTM
jgi:hypothetical protein